MMHSSNQWIITTEWKHFWLEKLKLDRSGGKKGEIRKWEKMKAMDRPGTRCSTET